MSERHVEIVPTQATQLNGQILPNAHACGDVDGDDATELIVGSMSGSLVVFKIAPERLTKWRSCEVDGSVTSIYIDSRSTGEPPRVFVATAEGDCFVFQFKEDRDEFRPWAEFRVALNVCDIAMLDGDLIFATRDGGLHVYCADPDDLGGYKQLVKFSLGTEIERFHLLAPTVENQRRKLLICCTTGEYFQLIRSDEEPVSRFAERWQSPLNENDVLYLVDNISNKGRSAHIAQASRSGAIALYDESFQTQWAIQLPETIVSIERYSISTSGQMQDALVACTWSGQVFVIKDPQTIVRFRMILPASSMFAADIYEDSENQTQALIGISTSGVIFIFCDLIETLSHALDSRSLVDRVTESAMFEHIKSEDLRKEVMKKLCKKWSEASEHTSELTVKEAPTLKDLLAFVAALPVPDENCDE